ncbi:MAG: hypothetical protein JST50_00460 [Bacteroidetes bacterium]|nr:hypothetical protein [Bacteroidota bacterium]
MKKLYIALVLLAVVWASCHNGSGSMTNKCGPCPMYTEVLPTVQVKIVSKTTGNDLFLSHTSPYKPSDLKVSSSVYGPDYRFVVDTSDTNNRFIWLASAESQTFTLQLANSSADNIKVVAVRDSPVCCPRLRIKSIALNDSLVCSPCGIKQQVVIKK